jgi:chloride channel protein, CIC family
VTAPTKPAARTTDRHGNLAMFGFLSLVAGGAAGFVGAMFRLTLQQADRWREEVLTSALGRTVTGLFLVVVACAAAMAIAAWLVRRFAPEASGSGIPHVEAVLNEKLPPAPFRLIPVKFIGGVLAIGSGQALGREGPSVQMGAIICHLLGKLFRRNDPDCRVLLAAGAGAGLATAFNAPVAGAVFVLEELYRRFDTRVAIATTGASAGAIAISRIFLGEAPDFCVAPLEHPGFGAVPVYLGLGAIVGLLGVAYNRAILAALAGAERLRRIPVEVRAAIVGVAVGVLGWFGPGLVGGGDPITQRALAGPEGMAFLPLFFLLRFVLGSVSYAAGTPGGLFAPMLVLGAQSGLLYGIAFSYWLPQLASDPRSFAVVGMAAFFTAVVRSPVTGIVLVTEMTGSFTLLLPMLGSCFAAMLVPTLLRDPPIYDSLGELALRNRPGVNVDAARSRGE